MNSTERTGNKNGSGQAGTDIANRYRTLLGQIREQEVRWSRQPESVLLLAVSKTHTPARLQQAYVGGARHFGENYLQEALEKIRILSEPQNGTPGIVWHFIGPIQSNKTRDIALHFDWVHSVDRLRVARRLHDQRPDHLPPLNVCVQVNLSAEDSKSGVPLDDVQELCRAISELGNLRLRGLMAIPAPSTDVEQQRTVFRPLREALHSLNRQFPDMDTLSIGMSDDYEAAIAEGSTIIRIGTAIFGSRAVSTAERPSGGGLDVL